jgi:hypothetical protein
MHKFIGIMTAMLLIIGLPSTGLAQEMEPLIDMDAQIEAARKLLRTERRLVHATELVLTPEESKAFWPVFNEYSAEIQAVGNRKIALIKEYAENFDNITDEFAERGLKESFAIESDMLRVKVKYRDRFKRALPIVKVVRFYQVESKLNAVIDFQLAAQIPLIEESKTSAGN